MDCAEGGLVWDDQIKRCEWTSSTCSANEGNSDDNGSNSDSGSNSGNDSDSGSGNSESGSDNSDSGSDNSDSGSNSQDGVCVSSCKSMKDGDYQSCKRCDGFVKCANELLFEMDCAEGGLVWDDQIKRCKWKSSTCSANEGNSNNGSNSGNDSDNDSDNSGSNSDSGSNSQDGVCVSSCKSMKDGDYQSCKRCDGFVKCANELL